jgi:hypothetical protein
MEERATPRLLYLDCANNDPRGYFDYTGFRSHPPRHLSLFTQNQCLGPWICESFDQIKMEGGLTLLCI